MEPASPQTRFLSLQLSSNHHIAKAVVIPGHFQTFSRFIVICTPPLPLRLHISPVPISLLILHAQLLCWPTVVHLSSHRPYISHLDSYRVIQIGAATLSLSLLQVFYFTMYKIYPINDILKSYHFSPALFSFV